MCKSTILFNAVLRRVLKDYRGYEAFCRLGSEQVETNGAGLLCSIFESIDDALSWCSEVQNELLRIDWPPALLDYPETAGERSFNEKHLLFRGLRVRMGIHFGMPRVVHTHKPEFLGMAIETAAQITTIAHGGQVLITEAALIEARRRDCKFVAETGRLIRLGKFTTIEAPKGIALPNNRKV